MNRDEENKKLELKDFMPINFLEKEKFTGSFCGMRFRMEKQAGEEGAEAVLKVSLWPEPYNYDSTDDKEKEWKVFSYNADGIAAGVVWLNERYEAQLPRWKAAGLNLE